jgi:AbrB family looped-hinge helix DNA binding protein
MYNAQGVCMTILTISSKGWVVIPAEIRRKYHLEPGTKVRLVDYGGVLSIVRIPDDPIREGRGMLKGGPSLSQEIVEEHRREVEADEQYFARHSG